MVPEIAGAGSGVPGPAMSMQSSGSQTLGHPETTGIHGRTESEVGAHRLDLAQAKREKRGALAGSPGEESLACQWVAGLTCWS